MAEDRMLSDEILLALIKKNSGGGGGGTTNYNNLENKPQIGGVTLTGNMTASDLGLVAAEAGKGLSSNNYTNEDKAIVGGVTAALAGKQDKTDNNLETTAKTIVGAINEHEGDIDSLKSGLTNYQAQNDLNLELPDRKNVLPNGVKSGSFAGVEWTLNADGSITFNGTATQQIFNKMYFSKDLDLPVGEYIYNGGSSLITFQLANKAESQAYYTYADYSGYIEVTQAMVGDMIARLIINNGTVLNNVTIYPMIRPKSIESGVYAPYIPSVESRIEEVESGLDTVKSGLTNLIKHNDYPVNITVNAGSVAEHTITDANLMGKSILSVVFTRGTGAYNSAVMSIPQFQQTSDNAYVRIPIYNSDSGNQLIVGTFRVFYLG